MQKVVGSSPIIRFIETRWKQRVSVSVLAKETPAGQHWVGSFVRGQMQSIVVAQGSSATSGTLAGRTFVKGLVRPTAP